jgi:hypothetical protein
MNGPPGAAKGPFPADTREGLKLESRRSPVELAEEVRSNCPAVNAGRPPGGAAGDGHVTDRGRGFGGGRDAPAAPPPGASAPLVSFPYGQKPHRVLLYEHGIRCEPTGVCRMPVQVTHQRGKIEGFSSKAASRLREFCVTMAVPDRVPVSVTLTTRAIHSPAAWKRIWKRFRQRAIERGVPMVYRVELQKRGAPHVHVVAWVVADHRLNPQHRRLFTEEWLECVGEDQDPDSRRFAVLVRRMDSSGWIVYQALHSGKGKVDQLGWQGKQWGVIGRERFLRREPDVVLLEDWQRIKFQRVLRRLLAASWRGPGCPRKARVLPLGNAWLRCIQGENVRRLLRWVGADVPSASESDARQEGRAAAWAS